MSVKQEPASVRFPFHFWVLLRCRAAQVRNALDQQLRDAPLRVFTVLVLQFVIWAALYLLLKIVLNRIEIWDLAAVVANQYIFVHLFLVLAVMLAFSNAILAFGSMFGREEAAYLLAMPATPRQAICVKWLEGMVLSSWSFLLLGVPLMLAAARNTDVAWYYYPLFIGHFLGFIIIPATLGLLAAWAVAMWAPRRPLAVLLACSAVLLAAGGLWVWGVIRTAEFGSDWLHAFYNQLSIAKQPMLPSTWSAKGIVAAIRARPGESWLYLAAVISTGAFLAWLTINLIGRTWPTAYSRARQGGSQTLDYRGWGTQFACDLAFFYLPSRLRMLMLKDLRSFLRDATQWTQMVIMLGLLIVYAVNLRRLPLDLDNDGTRALLVFLSLTTVCLIMATFTSRFIFPLLSLETQQLWLLGLLPVRRTSILAVKFIFSLTVTSLSAAVVVGLATQALGLRGTWAWTQLLVSLGICFGLSGLSVGLGARFPVLGQRNPARIASGFGGTVNLIVSMLFVAGEMAVLAVVGLRGFQQMALPFEAIQAANWLVPVLFSTGVLVGSVSLWLGARHFRRLEC